MRVLTWNLFHGRSVPGTRRELLGEFASMLARWSWDVAMLQEVPPWWPPVLARAAGAEERAALTSRNLGLGLRRALARRDPELMKSNGGGSNAVLARVPLEDHRAIRLRIWPERRIAQLVRLAGGVVIANHHGSTRVPLAEAELARLRALALEAAGPPPRRIVLGGDLNLRSPRVEGMEHVAERDVDHLFATGMRALGARTLARELSLDGRPVLLSDHPPLVAELAPAG